MSPAQSTVGIARGLGAATTQRRLPFASVKWDHAKADAALARVTLACLVFLNRLRSGNSGWAVPRSFSSLGCALAEAAELADEQRQLVVRLRRMA